LGKKRSGFKKGGGDGVAKKGGTNPLPSCTYRRLKTRDLFKRKKRPRKNSSPSRPKEEYQTGVSSHDGKTSVTSDRDLGEEKKEIRSNKA